MRLRCEHPAEATGRQSVARLVTAAAAVAPTATALTRSGVAVSFADLLTRARASALGTPGTDGASIDDSALTMALMTTVPGLAASGAPGLADTLSALRTRATRTLVPSRPA